MSGNRKIQVFFLAFVSVIGCRSPLTQVMQPQRINAQPILDERYVNAPDERMPKILPETHYAAARLLEEQGQISKAIIQYRKTIAVNHRYVAAYHRLGMLLSKGGRHEEAVEMLEKSVKLKPNEAVLRNNLGFELMFLEQWAQAKEHFNKAIELNPKLVRAQVNLGLVHSKLGEFDEALVCFKAVLPEADAWYNLGLMYRGQKRYEDAIKSFEQVLKCNPQFPAAKMQLAELIGYIQSPEEKIASRDLKVEIEPAPELPDTINLIEDVAADHSVDQKLSEDVVVVDLSNTNQPDVHPVVTDQKKIIPESIIPETVETVVTANAPSTLTRERSEEDTQPPPPSEKPEWENVFDDLARDFAGQGQELPKVEKTKLVMNSSDNEEPVRFHDQVAADKPEKPIQLPNVRISKIAVRTMDDIRSKRKKDEFLPYVEVQDADSSESVKAMEGLSLDEPEDEQPSKANRPAVIPETIDWFRDKLSIVRNEIACLETIQENVDVPVIMEMDIRTTAIKTSTTNSNRTILVNDEEKELKKKTKKTEPIADAGYSLRDQLLEIFGSTQKKQSTKVATRGFFQRVFLGNPPKNDLTELTSVVMNELQCWENQDIEQLAKKEAADQTREWMLSEYGESAQWLLQLEPKQPSDVIAMNEPDHDEEYRSSSTIEVIIRSARAFVMSAGSR